MLNEISLWFQMCRIREIEEEIARRYSEQEMRCPTHLSIGQEFAGALVGGLLEKTDQAVSTHRGHAHYLGKGGDLGAMIAEIYGKKTGCSGGVVALCILSMRVLGSTAPLQSLETVYQ